jgi:hypothetical protein
VNISTYYVFEVDEGFEDGGTVAFVEGEGKEHETRQPQVRVVCEDVVDGVCSRVLKKRYSQAFFSCDIG